MLDPRLAQVFEFDDTDLHFNRQGMLSPKQQAAQEQVNRSCLRTSIIITLVLLSATIGLLVLFGEYGSSVAGGLVTLGIFTLISGLLTLVAWKTRNDSDVMGQIEGQGWLRIDHGDNGALCILNINGYEFVVEDEAYEVLEDGASYRVYFAVDPSEQENIKSAGKFIMSIEHL